MNFFSKTKTGEALHGQHQSTMQTLGEIELLIRASEPVDPRAPKIQPRLESVARVLEEDVTGHFSFEEREVFPLLRDAGAGFMVDMLVGEHEVIRPLAEKLRGLALGAIDSGSFSAEDWATFCTTARELVDREVFHIQKEEMGLLSALAQVLSPETDNELAERHGAADPA